MTSSTQQSPELVNGVGTSKPRFYEKEELERLRDQLFETGSSFKPAEREDIVGIDNVLDEVDHIVHWLKYYPEYQKYGARIEPGAIFEGHAGTGKTACSRYIATQSEALFINVRDYPHEGSLLKDSDIASLFRRARAVVKKTNQPILIFWDEFEGYAKDRSDASAEEIAFVSQLTAELDGVQGKNEGILIIGCTNYASSIDSALRRSGRMGLHIEFHPPDTKGKYLLLEHYLGKYTIDNGLDIETLSSFFESGATAATIEEACADAWRFAVARTIGNNKKPSLVQDDLMRVFLKRLVGPPTTFCNLPKEERTRIAVHECGHAIMALVYDIPLRLVTVQPGKSSLGKVVYGEVQEHIRTFDDIFGEMRVAVGSIAAEERMVLPATTGSGSDLESLTKKATFLVDELYAGERTQLLNQGIMKDGRQGHRSSYTSPVVAEETVAMSDNDIRDLIRGVYEDAKRVMNNIGEDSLAAIAAIVNERTTLTGKEFEEAFAEVVGTSEFNKLLPN